MARKLSLLVLSLLTAGRALAEEEEWKLQKSGPVSVYTRHADGANVHEVRAVGVFEQPAERLFAALADLEHFAERMPATESVRVLRREGNSVVIHAVLNPPLIKRRDYCIRIRYERLPDGVLLNRWSQTNDDCPVNPAMVRMAENRGSWLLTPIDSNHTRIEYRGVSDPAGLIPAWMVNSAAAREMPGLLQAIAKAAASIPDSTACAPLLVCNALAVR